MRGRMLLRTEAAEGNPAEETMRVLHIIAYTCESQFKPEASLATVKIPYQSCICCRLSRWIPPEGYVEQRMSLLFRTKFSS